MFDEDAARASFLRGVSADRTSTQSWDIETWSAGWRDASGALSPGALGGTGGAWWFRAITDAGRLRGNVGEIASDALTSVGARARIAAFVGEANQLLVHWPLSALAPIAFPLREALGLNEAFAVLAESLPISVLVDYVDWLGPIDAGMARRWIGELDDAGVIFALGAAALAFEPALERLTALKATQEAGKLAALAPTQVHASWVLEAKQPVSIALLEASVDIVDDETFSELGRRLLRKRDRRVWEALTRRPLPALASKVLEHLGDPVSPWAFRFFEAGGEEMVDALIEFAKGRGKRAAAGLRALSHLDRTVVQLRIEALPDNTGQKLLEKLQPSLADLPELPRSQWPAWMTAVSQRQRTESGTWLDPDRLPQLATLSGHRLPRDVQRGILALLQDVRFDVAGDGAAADDYDSALDELRGLLDPDAANAWWHALFAMWWTNHRPEVRWVMYAAAFLCDGLAIRDLGTKLRRHQTWFGNLSSRVIAALGHNPTPWAVAALDDIAHRSSNATHRQIAANFLERRARAHGVTVDRFVSLNYPNETDPVLIDAAARRTERAMVEQREWSEFLLREHLEIAPFKAVSSAIVWCLNDEWGGASAFFHVDEAELLDLFGEAVEVGEGAITVAHPAQLDDALLMQWHEHSADHEIVQPFAQLERARFRAASLSKDGFQSPVGSSVTGRDFLRRADSFGWRPILKGAHGDIVGVARDFESMDVRGELRLSEPLEHDGSGESAIAGIAFSSLRGDALPHGDVHPVAFSESHYDITRIMKSP